MNILVAAISLSVVVGVNFKSGHVGICCSGHVSGGGLRTVSRDI